MTFFLHFSSIYIHQTLQFYSYLGFYRGVCSYIILPDLYNILFPDLYNILYKTMVIFFSDCL